MDSSHEDVLTTKPNGLDRLHYSMNFHVGMGVAGERAMRESLLLAPRLIQSENTLPHEEQESKVEERVTGVLPSL